MLLNSPLDLVNTTKIVLEKYMQILLTSSRHLKVTTSI